MHKINAASTHRNSTPNGKSYNYKCNFYKYFKYCMHAFFRLFFFQIKKGKHETGRKELTL